MVASVHVLHASPPEVGGFLRIGHTGHRKLEALLAANRLYFRRFVFDAAHIAEQIELVKSLRVNGCEIVLDPNSAEMAALGRFNSSVSKLPWAIQIGLGNQATSEEDAMSIPRRPLLNLR